MLFLVVFQWARVFSPTYADGHLGSFDFRVHQVNFIFSMLYHSDNRMLTYFFRLLGK